VNAAIPEYPSPEIIRDLLIAFDEQVKAEAVQDTSREASQRAFIAINRTAKAFARVGRWWAVQPDQS
jgi:hypothetical protein